jgi:AraC family transcriptional regulator
MARAPRQGIRVQAAPAPVARRVTSWGLEPEHVGLASRRRSGLSAAVWADPSGKVSELQSEADPQGHVLVMELGCGPIEYFVDGRLTFRGSVRPGDLAFLHAGQRPRTIKPGPWRMMHLYVPDALIAACGREDAGLDSGLRPTAAMLRDPQLTATARLVLDELRSPARGSRLLLDALGLQIGVLLLRRHGLRSGPEPSASGLCAPRLQRVLDTIEANLAADLSLADLAAVAGLSLRHFATAFRASTGLPPHRYLVARRLERAKEFLASPAFSMTEVALACGFASSSHFATSFRQHLGMTPSRYRRELA